MATIQVIYDERDSVPLPKPADGVSFSVMSLPSFYSKHEMEDAAHDLVLGLLRYHFGYLKDRR